MIICKNLYNILKGLPKNGSPLYCGKTCNVFNNSACFFIDETYITVHNSTIMYPYSICINKTNNFKEQFPLGTDIYFFNNSLIINTTTIDIEICQKISTFVDLKKLLFCNGKFLEYILNIIFSIDFSNSNSPFFKNDLLFSPILKTLEIKTQKGEPIDSLIEFCGIGNGQTPDSDDFLTGLFILCRNELSNSKKNKIKTLILKKSTTDTSKYQMIYALNGHINQAVKNLIDNLALLYIPQKFEIPISQPCVQNTPPSRPRECGIPGPDTYNLQRFFGSDYHILENNKQEKNIISLINNVRTIGNQSGDSMLKGIICAIYRIKFLSEK